MGSKMESKQSDLANVKGVTTISRAGWVTWELPRQRIESLGVSHCVI